MTQLPSGLPEPHDFQSIFEMLPDLYLILSPDFKIVAVNSAYLKATFSVRQEIINRHIVDVFPDNPSLPPETKGSLNLLRSLDRVVKTKNPDAMAVQRYDIPFASPSGTVFKERYWSSINFPFIGPAGEVVYIIHRVEDVTDYIQFKQNKVLPNTENFQTLKSTMEREIFVRAQQIQTVNEKLRKSEERFRLIIECVKDYAIFMLDPEGYITSWNQGAQRILGYTREEVIGKNFSTFYTAEDLKCEKCERELYEAATFGHFEDEGWRLRKDGTKFWASTIITALRDKGGVLQGFSKVTRDITEKKTNEDRLRHAYETLEKRVEERTQDLEKTNASLQDALQSTDEFFSIASHELKTPITVLKIQIQLLQKIIENSTSTPLTSTSVLPRIGIVNQQINKLTALVNNLLDVSRIKNKKLNIEPTETNLSSLIDNILTRILDQANELGIKIKAEIQDQVFGMFDKLRIEQMLMNILSNAIKYGKSKPIEVKLTASGTTIQLVVKDHGIGISLADQSRIFGRFERAVSEKDYNGMGLGLYITKQIVDSHGGTIRLESELGKGTEFIIELPCNNIKKIKEEPHLGKSTNG